MSGTMARGMALLSDLYRETLTALSGRMLVRTALSRTPIPALHVRIFGLGKAACSMAQGAAEALRVDFSGVLAAHEVSSHPRQLGLWIGDHPIPSDASQKAGVALLSAVRSTRPEDFALFLVSGGGSAIASLPAEGLSVSEIAATTDALLRSGISIDEINTVRRQLTQIGGGRLRANCRAHKALVLMLSDIASGRITSLASGPTLPDASGFSEALEIVERSKAALPSTVLEFLRQGRDDLLLEMSRPSDTSGTRTRHRVLATPHTLAQEAQLRAEQRGLVTHIVNSAFDGSFDTLVHQLSNRAQEFLKAPSSGPALLVASGEPRLSVPPGSGRGGRMQQLALTLAQDLSGSDFCALCAGSDGRDGATEFAGACVDGMTAQMARSQGLEITRFIERFDASSLIRSIGAGIDRFPSETNLTDLVLILVRPSKLGEALLFV